MWKCIVFSVVQVRSTYGMREAAMSVAGTNGRSAYAPALNFARLQATRRKSWQRADDVALHRLSPILGCLRHGPAPP